MQIICEFCGHVIDTDTDKRCTHCGTPFKNNKSYKNVVNKTDNASKTDDANQKEKFTIRVGGTSFNVSEIETTEKHTEITGEQYKHVVKTVKLISTFVVLFMITFFISIFSVVFMVNMNDSTDDEIIDEIIDDNIPSILGLNTWAKSNNGDILISEVKTLSNAEAGIELPEDEQVIIVKFSIKNNKERTITIRSDIECFTTHNKRPQSMLDKYAALGESVQPEHILSGWYIFKVPKNTDKFIFVYEGASIIVYR